MLKALPEKFDREGYKHILIRRNGKAAIYEVLAGKVSVGWEVGKVVKKPYPLHLESRDRDIPFTEYEGRWKNEDFGKKAWFVKSFTKALDKYELLSL